jgi:hypothetical protein
MMLSKIARPHGHHNECMKPVLTRSLLIATALALVLYLGDYISIKYRIPGGREQFGSVEVEKLLAVPQKNHKIEYIADPPEAQQCVYSLFPQLGLAPCWYLARHARQQVNY